MSCLLVYGFLEIEPCRSEVPAVAAPFQDSRRKAEKQSNALAPPVGIEVDHGEVVGINDSLEIIVPWTRQGFAVCTAGKGVLFYYRPTHLHTLADQSSVVRWMLMLFMLDFYFESLAPTLVPHFSHQLIRAGTQQRVLCRISITYQPFVGQALLRMFRPPAGQKTESPASSEREATHAGYTGRKRKHTTKTRVTVKMNISRKATKTMIVRPGSANCAAGS